MNAGTMVLVTLLAVLSGGAMANTCADHATVMERLADGYGESRQSIGLGADNAMVEIFASLETGTWTIAVTAPGGPTCLVASGFAYEPLAEGLVNTDPGA